MYKSEICIKTGGWKQSRCPSLSPTVKLKSHQLPYQPLVEHHVSEPLEVQSFEGREDKQGLGLVAFSLLDGPLWIGDPHGGLGADVFLKASHWGLI